MGILRMQGGPSMERARCVEVCLWGRVLGSTGLVGGSD